VNKLTVDTTTAFSKKTFYIKAMTTGRVSICKKMELEVCGHAASTINPSEQQFFFVRGSGTANIQIPLKYTSYFSVDTSGCALTMTYSRLKLDGSTYVGTEITLESNDDL
jgi:hypothetical protein